jgi:nucleoside-diphosphate-sugar epimerase
MKQRSAIKRWAPDVVLDMISVTQRTAQTVVYTFLNIAKRLIVISSQDVYWAYAVATRRETGLLVVLPIEENSPCRSKLFPYRGSEPRMPDDPRRWLDDYDKILVEHMAGSEPALPATVLRLPMVYGPNDRQHRLFDYIKRMDDERPAIILEEGFASWRWTRGYVENVATAIALAVVDDRATGCTYNVGEPETLPMAAWIEQIGKIAGWMGEILRVPEKNLPESMHSTLRTEQNLVVDSSRIREELGYVEPVDQERALRETVAWERSNPPSDIDSARFDYTMEDKIIARVHGT